MDVAERRPTIAVPPRAAGLRGLLGIHPALPLVALAAVLYPAAVGVSPWVYRVVAFTLAGLFAGIAGALSAPLYLGPPGTLQYIAFDSLFYLAIAVLAGVESLTGVVAVAVAFTLIPQIVLDWRINVFLVGGVGLAVGVLLGPRGVSGLVTDLFDGRRRTSTGTASRP